MKRIVLMLILLCVVVASAAEVVIPDAQGVGSGACSDPDTVWYINGIGGTWLAVGQPNILNRRDRVVFRFPIIKYMPQCKVRKATLRFDYTAAGEQKRDNLIEVEHFTSERLFISGKDLNSTFTDSVAQFVHEPADVNVRPPSITVMSPTAGCGVASMRSAAPFLTRFSFPAKVPSCASAVPVCVTCSVAAVADELVITAGTPSVQAILSRPMRWTVP